ncbi:hypothetical protein NUBL17187_45570 [Klebsiella michiganensis]|nr:hypothetical protein NUBL17187_45570 [Klebsiella michiganensis]
MSRAILTRGNVVCNKDRDLDCFFYVFRFLTINISQMIENILNNESSRLLRKRCFAIDRPISNYE